MAIGMAIFLLVEGSAYAAPVAPNAIPGPADVNRINPLPQFVPDHSRDQEETVPSGSESIAAPEAAKSIHFVLHGISIEGATVFSQKDLWNVYTPYLGQDVSLDIAWQIAAKITDRYTAAGYFLSRAYVPQQHMKNGVIVIKVIEGYIGAVDLKDSNASNHVIRTMINRLTDERPVKAADLESFLLRLNDLPGDSFRSVLSPLKNAKGPDAGGVLLTLAPAPKASEISDSIDNYGSRFLGPEEVSVSYQTSFLPLQRTSLSLSSSMPLRDTRSAALTHAITLTPELVVNLSGSYTKAHPGFTLEPEDINSSSGTLGAELMYQYLRQRDENLSFTIGLDGRNSDSDLLDEPQVRDRIRALRAGFLFDDKDSWQGQNNFGLTLSQGLPLLDSSHADDQFLSRAGAVPDFTKLALNASRLQSLNNYLSIQAATASQWSARPLYSAEQFGYGGQAFGRAYDASQILGDKGIEGSLELRYDALNTGDAIKLIPYGFYDIGAVWDNGANAAPRQSGASAGAGLRLTTRYAISGNIGVAFPLTREITTPIYGGNTNNPRILAQLGGTF
jgi:hemolysin activation/secretion protein